jgi:hypothetical protein
VSVISTSAVNALSAVEPRYVRVSAYGSAAGLAVGFAWWLSLGPAHGVTAVAVGYLVGSLVQTGMPMGVAWRHYRMPWTELLVRLVSGSLIALAAARALNAVDARPWLSAAASLVFAVAWWVAGRGDVRLLLERLPRRIRPGRASRHTDAESG